MDMTKCESVNDPGYQAFANHIWQWMTNIAEDSVGPQSLGDIDGPNKNMSGTSLSPLAIVPKRTVSNISMRGSGFLGRSDILQTMHKHFSSTPMDTLSGPSCCVLHGLGGIGKTQIALEYAHQYSSEFYAIFWVKAENEGEPVSTFASISRKLGLLQRKSQTTFLHIRFQRG
jgi:hypothetical protein